MHPHLLPLLVSKSNETSCAKGIGPLEGQEPSPLALATLSLGHRAIPGEGCNCSRQSPGECGAETSSPVLTIDWEDKHSSDPWAADHVNLDGQLVLATRHLLIFLSVESMQKK